MDNSRANQIFSRFKKFHKENPEIWELFQRFTFEVITRGRTHYSANAIFQRIRWHVEIETTSEEPVKLNDHYHAYYARMFIAAFPRHDGFFQLRRRTTVDRPAYANDISVFDTGPAKDEFNLMQELRDLLM